MGKKAAAPKRTPKAKPDGDANNRVLVALEGWTQELARNTAAMVALTAAMRAKAGPVAAVPADGSHDPTPATTLSTPAPAPAKEKPAKEYKAPTPCEGCGANLDEPGVKHSAACTKVKVNGKSKSPEELVEEAKPLFLKYAQSAGREAAVALLQKFGTTKLTEIAVAKLPEFVAWLHANGEVA